MILGLVPRHQVPLDQAPKSATLGGFQNSHSGPVISGPAGWILARLHQQPSMGDAGALSLPAYLALCREPRLLGMQAYARPDWWRKAADEGSAPAAGPSWRTITEGSKRVLARTDHALLSLPDDENGRQADRCRWHCRATGQLLFPIGESVFPNISLRCLQRRHLEVFSVVSHTSSQTSQ